MTRALGVPQLAALGSYVKPSTEKADPRRQPNAPYIGLEHIERDIGVINGQGRAADVRSTKSVFHTGDLLYGKLRPYLNKVWVAQFDGVCSTDILVFPRNDNVDTRFLKYRFMASDFVAFASERSNGVNLPRVNAKALASFPLSLPPADEQRGIVEAIETQFARLDAGVAALRRTQANLTRYRAAVLKAACEGRLVPTEAELAKADGRRFESGEELLTRILGERRRGWNGRGKYMEPANPDVAVLPAPPLGWTWSSVDAIGFVTKLAGFEYTKHVRYSPDGDLAVIKAENAGRSGFKQTDFSRIKSSTVAQLTRSQVVAGDLLMVFVGAGTGNVARVPDDQPYFLGPNIGMIRVLSRQVAAAYAEIFLRSPKGNSLAVGLAKAVAQPSLSMGTIRLIPIAVPPLAEQIRIVTDVERRLSVVADLERSVAESLSRSASLRRSALKAAFTGGS